MKILALEFSSARRSVAIAHDEIFLAEAAEENSARGTNVFALIEKVLTTAKIEREKIEAIAVGLGPGSYTGIRAAIAVAQGWQLARGVKLLGIGSAETLAAQAQAAKIFGRVNVVIDAQRGEFYLASWEISGARREEISPLKIVTAAEIERRVAADDFCVGPEMARTLFPSAAMTVRLAAGRTDFLAGEALEPVYLRATNFVKAPVRRDFGKDSPVKL